MMTVTQTAANSLPANYSQVAVYQGDNGRLIKVRKSSGDGFYADGFYADDGRSDFWTATATEMIQRLKGRELIGWERD